MQKIYQVCFPSVYLEESKKNLNGAAISVHTYFKYFFAIKLVQFAIKLIEKLTAIVFFFLTEKSRVKNRSYFFHCTPSYKENRISCFFHWYPNPEKNLVL